MTGRSKFTVNALRARFGLDTDAINELIGLDILIPDNWHTFSEQSRASYVADDFRFAIWSLAEIERFERIKEVFMRNYQLFFLQTGMRFDALERKADIYYNQIARDVKKMLQEMAELKFHVDRKDMYIDSNYFCTETGYKMSSFHNHMEAHLEGGIEIGHVMLGHYKSLKWTRVLGEKKWKARLLDFEKLRSGFPYELQLEERKRLGKFKVKHEINFTDIK